MIELRHREDLRPIYVNPHWILTVSSFDDHDGAMITMSYGGDGRILQIEAAESADEIWTLIAKDSSSQYVAALSTKFSKMERTLSRTLSRQNEVSNNAAKKLDSLYDAITNAALSLSQKEV